MMTPQPHIVTLKDRPGWPPQGFVSTYVTLHIGAQGEQSYRVDANVTGPALDKPVVGYHRGSQGEWLITHVPTGLSIGRVKGPKAAEKACRALAAILPSEGTLGQTPVIDREAYYAVCAECKVDR